MFDKVFNSKCMQYVELFSLFSIGNRAVLSNINTGLQKADLAVRIQWQVFTGCVLITSSCLSAAEWGVAVLYFKSWGTFLGIVPTDSFSMPGKLTGFERISSTARLCVCVCTRGWRKLHTHTPAVCKASEVINKNQQLSENVPVMYWMQTNI